MSKKIKVIHVQFAFPPREDNKLNYYFGSKTAVCRFFTKEEIGIGHAYLKGLNLSQSDYHGKKCSIFQDSLLTLGDVDVIS